MPAFDSDPGKLPLPGFSAGWADTALITPDRSGSTFLYLRRDASYEPVTSPFANNSIDEIVLMRMEKQ